MPIKHVRDLRRVHPILDAQRVACVWQEYRNLLGIAEARLGLGNLRPFLPLLLRSGVLLNQIRTELTFWLAGFQRFSREPHLIVDGGGGGVGCSFRCQV
jgi:hypothetical protein